MNDFRGISEKGNDRLMNKTILMGRLCADPDVRYTTGDKAICVARYRLAVNRTYSRDGEQQADFISCVAFGMGSSQRSICIKVSRLQLSAESRQEVTPIRTDREYTQRMLSLKIRNLQKAKDLVLLTSRNRSHRMERPAMMAL